MAWGLPAKGYPLACCYVTNNFKTDREFAFRKMGRSLFKGAMVEC
jgi:hypothetical protein